MTTLDPILYANGQLRLTDHGPRGGGRVLVYASPDGSTAQVDKLRDDEVASLQAMLNCNYHPAVIVDQLRGRRAEN